MGALRLIGTALRSEYLSITDFQCSADYLAYMYENAAGFITRSGIHNNIYKERFGRFKQLTTRKYDGLEDIYTSMNTFYTYERKVDKVKRLNALFVDLDYYKLGLSPESVLFDLYDNYFGRKIPHPTFVIDSGRGMYLIWKINEDKNALPRWTSIMKYLVDICAPFNADHASTDAARILRVPFSVNSKSGNPVRIIDFNDISYTLHEIIREYDIKPSNCRPQKAHSDSKYPHGEATKRMRNYASLIAEQKCLELPDFSNFDNTFSFIADNKFAHGEHVVKDRGNIRYFAASNKSIVLDGRCRDLETLFSLRNKAECKREIGLFLYRLWLCESTNNYDYAQQQTLLFNSKLKFSLDEKYVLKRTESAERMVKKGRTYNYRVDTLVKILEITAEESQYLKYLVSSHNSASPKENKKARNRRAYLSRLEKDGKATKTDSVNARRETIAMLRVDGNCVSDICDMLHISRRTYERDIVIIEAEGIATRAAKVVKQTAVKIRAACKKTASNVLEAARSFSQAAFNYLSNTEKNKFSNTKPNNATKIKPSYYKRTPYGCSACAFSSYALGEFIQLSMFDLLDTATGDSS